MSSQIVRERPLEGGFSGGKAANRIKDGKIKKDYQIDEPRDAAEELRNLPPVEEDEDDEE